MPCLPWQKSSIFQPSTQMDFFRLPLWIGEAGQGRESVVDQSSVRYERHIR